MRRGTHTCTLALTLAFVLSGCTSSDEVDLTAAAVGWAEEIVEVTDRPREPAEPPTDVGARPQRIDFEWREDTLVLEEATAAELTDVSTLVVPAGELDGFEGVVDGVAFVVAPPTARLPVGLNESVHAVELDGDTVRFTVEPVEFGAPFAAVSIDVTDVPTDESLQQLADAINTLPIDDERSRYRAEVVDVAEVELPDDDPTPMPDLLDGLDLDDDVGGIDAAQVSALAAEQTVSLATWRSGAGDTAQLAVDDGFTTPAPPQGSTRYQPEKALKLKVQELATCEGTTEWRDGLTVTGEPCDPDRFWLQLDVSLIPSFDFKYEARRTGRPSEAVIGLNAQTVLHLELRGASRGSYCNEDCQLKLEREKDAVQRRINEAGDLLDLYGDARLALALLRGAGVPNVSVELLWPLEVTYDVAGTFDSTVSGFTGAGITWDRSLPRDERANAYVIPLDVDSRANLSVNAAATVTTGPEIAVLAGRMFGPTISVQGTLDGTGLAHVAKLDATWQDAIWLDHAWNVDYLLEGVVKLRAQDPFIGRVKTDWELLRHTFADGTLVRSAPSHPRLRAEQVHGVAEVTLQWTEPAHAERYELWASSSSTACRRAAAAGAGRDAIRLATPRTGEHTFVPAGTDDLRFVCVAALGRGPRDEATRSAASNVVDLTRTPPPPVPVEFDVDGWLAQPFDLSWSVCDPPRWIVDYDPSYLQERFPGWQPPSVVGLTFVPAEDRNVRSSWWYDVTPGEDTYVDGTKGTVTSLAQGDMTGDGRDDALVVVDCFHGANSSVWELAAFTRDQAGMPQLLGVVSEGYWSSQGGIQLDNDVVIVDGEVRIRTEERYGPWWDETIPTDGQSRTFRWDGREFLER
jgi:hypothetical protein